MSTPEISQLETQARQAYEQRRTRECVGFVKSLLQTDPSNSEGQRLQAAIQKEIQRDLSDAHALIEESKGREDGAKYRKAAEIILLKLMYLDPDNETAKSLLASSRMVDEHQEDREERAAVHFAGFTTAHSAEAPAPRPVEVPFTTGTVVETTMEVRTKNRFTVPIVIFILVATGAAAFFLIQSGAIKADGSSGVDAPPQAFQPLPSGTPSPAESTTTVASTTPFLGEPLPVPPPAVTPDLAATTEPESGAASRFESSRPVAFVEAGTLKVTSSLPADVLMNGKPVGTTPLSLQLIAGRHTLEYRRGDLKTVVTHEIKANQTTNSVVSFDMKVQINARPWALVSVEGTPRRPLGQTPLSSVSVPLGSVLVFENPNFTPKSHRVAEGDTAIQMIFP